MKKIIALLLCIIVAVSVASCGKTPEPIKDGDAVVESVKTLGDFYKLQKDGFSFSYNDEIYVGVFEIGDKSYRVAARISSEIYDKLEEVDFFADDRNKQFEEILKDVNVSLVEDLGKYILTETELDALKGKTGQQLLDKDFYVDGYDFSGRQVVFMSDGKCEYSVYFNENIDYDDEDEESSVEDAIANLTVKKAEFIHIATGALCDPDSIEA